MCDKCSPLQHVWGTKANTLRAFTSTLSDFMVVSCRHRCLWVYRGDAAEGRSCVGRKDERALISSLPSPRGAVWRDPTGAPSAAQQAVSVPLLLWARAWSQEPAAPCPLTSTHHPPVASGSLNWEFENLNLVISPSPKWMLIVTRASFASLSKVSWV